MRQGLWAYLIGLLGELAFYGAYAWIALRTARGELSYGEMTMFLLVFRSAQQSIHGVLGEVQADYDNLLYVSDLFAFLDKICASSSFFNCSLRINEDTRSIKFCSAPRACSSRLATST
jgi:ABC-type multidrug transport system fused ATPase/permease subunit